ncbi:Spo0E like sporulation regulatory protein [Natranaerofaba carboxydovora]|nr:Spo0E like sporulation regulatory protein [Natranaerofaba carboxydovora]
MTTNIHKKSYNLVKLRSIKVLNFNERGLFMSNSLKDLLQEIEGLRDEIETLYETRDFTDPEIIKKSQELDEKLNEYNRLITN